MDTAALPTDLKTWAEAQIAAGRAASIDALAAEALATVKSQQEAIAARLSVARTEAERDGWIAGEDAQAMLRAWIAEDEAEDAAAK
jgi:hypothetical protein